MTDPAPPGLAGSPIAAGRPTFAYEPASEAPSSIPALSVVTRFCDDGDQFVETARSLHGQSLQDWEWLVSVDAVSREAVLRLVDACGLGPRTRLLETPQAALGAARSACVLQLPAGDLLEPTAAEKWLWFLASHPAVDGVDSLHVSISAQAPAATNAESWVGVVRRAALGATNRRNATLPEYLHWSRSAGIELGPAGTRDERNRRHGERTPRIELEGKPFGNALGKTGPRLLMVFPFVTTGGADKFNVDLVSELSRRGWETTVVTTLDSENPWLPRIARYTPDVFALPTFLQPSDYPRFTSYLLDSRRPDAMLISNSVFGYTALPYLRRVAPNVAILDFCHSVVETWFDGGYPRLSLDMQACLELQVTSSAAVKGWMVDRGGARDRIEVCYTGATPRRDRERPSRAGLGLPDGVPIILYPCRLTHEKQPAVFARTVAELHRRGHAFHALVVGDGPYLGWLERFVNKHALGTNVRFLGYQPNDRVRDLMTIADCVFLPSKYEGISVVFFEAMAEGVPVVGADVGGQRELVTPDCGILISRGDEDQEVRRYTEALARLIEDTDARRTMGEAAQARIESDFTLERMGDRMEVLLERAIELVATAPREAPSVLAARDAAHKAVLTASWQSSGGAVDGSISSRLRHLAYRALGSVAMPVYRLGLQLGFHWLEPLKDRVFQALFPSSR